jgi:hypothetical protein
MQPITDTQKKNARVAQLYEVSPLPLYTGFTFLTPKT